MIEFRDPVMAFNLTKALGDLQKCMTQAVETNDVMEFMESLSAIARLTEGVPYEENPELTAQICRLTVSRAIDMDALGKVIQLGREKAEELLGSEPFESVRIYEDYMRTLADHTFRKMQEGL